MTFKSSDSNLVLHLGWTIAVLVLAGAALVSYEPTGAVIRDYLSFASAIASIVLAVVAIFYSMISNQSFSETIGSMKNSSSNSEEATKNLTEASLKLSKLSDSIIGEISLLQPRFDEISNQISSRLPPAGGGKLPPETQDNSRSAVPTGRKKPTSRGLVISIYLIWMSYKNKEPFDTNDVFEASWANYTSGCLSVFAAFEVEGVNVTKLGNDKFIATSIGELTEERVLKLAKSEKGNEKQIEKIDKYFSELSSDEKAKAEL